jgi:hypothetical protein
MVEDTWYSVAIPILEYVHEHGDFKPVVTVGLIAETTGIDPADVAEELERRVDAGFISGLLHQYLSGGDFSVWSLRRRRSVSAGYASSAPVRATTPTTSKAHCCCERNLRPPSSMCRPRASVRRWAHSATPPGNRATPPRGEGEAPRVRSAAPAEPGGRPQRRHLGGRYQGPRGSRVLRMVDQLTDRGHYGPGTRSGPTHAPSPVVQVVVAADTAPSEGVTTAAVGEVTRTAAQDIGEQGCPALIVSVALGSHNAAPTPSPEFSGIGRFEPPPSCLIGTPTI